MTHRLLVGYWLSLGEEQEQQEEPHQNLQLLNIPKSIFGPKIFFGPKTFFRPKIFLGP